MNISDFTYRLPADRIAQRPLDRRDASRMLVLSRQDESWNDSLFARLPELLRGDELIVVNNARVIPARLLGKRVGIRAEKLGKNSRIASQFLSSEIEILLTREIAADEWEALVRPGRKMQLGERVEFGNRELSAEVVGRGEYGLRRLRLTAPDNDVRNAIERLGHVPLPPYITREDETTDRARYQTIFAARPGAVAAPTAGLHFTPEILAAIKERGVKMVELTLDVGLGTFQPIHVQDISEHRIHQERYEIPVATANAICKAKQESRPILAIGTTVVRALEDSAAKTAAGPGHGSGSSGERLLQPGTYEATIFLTPDHRFRVVDQLLTNFHLPQSTLLILVSAFAGREFILRSYNYAVEAGYRFYSYGDCMLIR